MSVTRIKFNNKIHSDFSTELKQNVQQYFTENNISPYANLAMVIKTICMFALYLVPFGLILSQQFNEWQMLGLCAIMGLGVAGIGFAVQHDANHSAYSSHEWINKALGFSLSIVGGSDYMWRIKHNVLHHTYTNIHGKDEDISVAAFLRLSPNAPFRPIHKVQHWIAWFAYCLLTLFWVLYSDFPKISRYNGFGSPNSDVKHPTKEIVMLFVMKIFYLLYILVLPMIILSLPWWKIILGFIVMHLIAGFVLTIIFQLAHVVENTDHPLPAQDGAVDNAWLVHQLETTANFSVHNPLLTWYAGGLNYQVEHHLFPKICSIHYPAISNIVRQTAEKHGLRYNVIPDFGTALHSHYKMLKKFSRP